MLPGGYFLFILGHFGQILGHWLYRNHGNPEPKAIIFRNIMTRGTSICIKRKFWEILKMTLVQSGTLYQKTGL